MNSFLEKNASSLTFGFLSLLALALLAAIPIANKSQHLARLDPAAQKTVLDYDAGMSKARIGDFVTVRNYDNLESARTLMVTDITGYRLHLVGRDPLIDTHSLYAKPVETMHLDRGDYERTLSKLNVVFLHKEINPEGWKQTACWYYGVTYGD